MSSFLYMGGIGTVRHGFLSHVITEPSWVPPGRRATEIFVRKTYAMVNDLCLFEVLFGRLKVMDLLVKFCDQYW